MIIAGRSLKDKKMKCTRGGILMLLVLMVVPALADERIEHLIT